MSETKNTNALAVIDDSRFPFLSAMRDNPDVDLPALMQENLGDDDFSPFDLDRIVLPGSGGTMWTIPTIDGEVEAKSFQGIILSVHKARSFWQSEMDGEGTPPDCSSDNGVTGFGSPGGDCAACPLNVFGSGKNNSKACKETKHIYVLLEGSVLPLMLQVPPTSLKAVKQYQVRLMGHGLKSINGVVTEFGLEKVKSRSGFVHAKLVLKAVGDLTGEQKACVKSFRDAIEMAIKTGADKRQQPAEAHGEEAPASNYEEAPKFDE